ncbi:MULTISPECIES: YjiH family protein [Halomonadaceae]|uniref:YjiH family protein n=1 Tax=Halomonadaceae TaxID=28256 RepID=UPI00159A6699|nr:MULTISPECIES: YjiH family protein [Halomonas]QJQ93872.1 YjiH family protein [Halomonas sp. PA5]
MIATQAPPAILLKLLLPSLLGIFVFFVPITLNGTTTIPLDHMVTALRALLGDAVRLYAMAVIVAGALYPILTGRWRESRTEQVFTLLKGLGVVFGVLALTGVGPAALHTPDMLPFLFDRLVVSVGLIVPIGAIFLALLINYGLLEGAGVLCQPLMRPLWRTPGRSAIDAVASFVGSYSIGLLITNRVYQAGQYSAREAAIIATGFSTVSVTFMLVVGRTLDLMPLWNLYFWLTLAITFAVTAITVRLPPLSRLDGDSSHAEIVVPRGQRLSRAWQESLAAAERAPNLAAGVGINLKEGMLMAMSILPSILSVGLIGLLLAKFTPVFEWIGLLFYPLIALFGIEEARQLSQAAASGLAEMFLPALLMVDAELPARFAAGVISVSSILFFSASIPCILSTRIPLSIAHIVAIWFLRTLFSLALAIPAGYFAAWLVS